MTEPNLDKIIDELLAEAIEKAITEWAGQEYPNDATFYDVTVKEAKQAIKALIANQVREAIEQTFIPLSQLYDQYSDECFRLGINDSPQAFFRSEKVKEYLGTTLNGVKK